MLLKIFLGNRFFVKWSSYVSSFIIHLTFFWNYAFSNQLLAFTLTKELEIMQEGKHCNFFVSCLKRQRFFTSCQFLFKMEWLLVLSVCACMRAFCVCRPKRWIQLSVATHETK